MLFLLLIYFVLGAVTGLLSGLLGIGGGIIVVPTLAFIFTHEHIPSEYVMHLAVGTSLAVMVFTTVRSLTSHVMQQSRVIFWDIGRMLLPMVVVGVVLGVLFADRMHSSSLRVLFGLFIVVIAVRIFFFIEQPATKRQLPTRAWMHVAGIVMGMLSGLLGIGGGTTVIPFLLHFKVSMRVAIRVAVMVGIAVSLIGAISFYIAGLDEALPMHTLGYIYWPAWVGIGMGSVLFAPLGVRLSHYMSTVILKRIFACLLILIGLQMLFFR